MKWTNVSAFNPFRVKIKIFKHFAISLTAISQYLWKAWKWCKVIRLTFFACQRNSPSENEFRTKMDKNSKEVEKYFQKRTICVVLVPSQSLFGFSNCQNYLRMIFKWILKTHNSKQMLVHSIWILFGSY